MNQEIEPPFEACVKKPFVFVSYAHKDKRHVYPIIKKLFDNGIPIWYDEGIPPSSKWLETIGKRISECTTFLVFISNNAINSENVKNEIAYAVERYYKREIKFLPIYIEETELTPELKITILRIQAIMKYKINERSFYKKLLNQFSDLKEMQYPKQIKEQQKIKNELIPKAEKTMQANNWKQAIEVWKEIKETASTYNWPDISRIATENINECKQQQQQQQQRIEKRKNIENELIPTAEKAMQANNWQHATNIWQKIKDIATDYGFSDIKQKALEQGNKCDKKFSIFQTTKNIIKDLEESIGKSLPEVEKIDYATVGVKFDGDKVIGLGLYKCGLKTLPDSFCDLKNLQKLILWNNKL
ncbi:MAG: toll/interleukin-1 receptor domain-containing protein, partial [Promethearchaeota archaeon]